MKPTDEEIVEAMAKALCRFTWPDCDPDELVSPYPRRLWERYKDEARAALAVAKIMLAQQSAPDSVHVVFKETKK